MDYKLINGRNYFNAESLETMAEHLENGETIGIYIDCVGRTRSEYETSNYLKALEEKYGDELVVDTKTSHIPVCRLRGDKQ